MKKLTKPKTTVRKKERMKRIDVLPPSVWMKHQGKCIIFSEDEQKVIGVADNWTEAGKQARASGVGGLWHYHHAERWDVENA